MPALVADAGPLIALSRSGGLALLRSLFDRVVVPAQVVRELGLAERRPGAAALLKALDDGWMTAQESASERGVAGLGEGESAAIRLAEDLGWPLLVDERRGRAVARKRGVRIIGTGWILLAAKERGLIDSVTEWLIVLRTAGYRLSDALCARLLELADEGR